MPPQLAPPEEAKADLLADLNARIRVLEGRYNLLRERVLIINQNMLTEHKRLVGEMAARGDDIKALKDDVFKIKEMVKHFIKEMAGFAKKADVVSLEKYINLWDPMKFVTEKEVVALIKENVTGRVLKNQKKVKEKKGGK